MSCFVFYSVTCAPVGQHIKHSAVCADGCVSAHRAFCNIYNVTTTSAHYVAGFTYIGVPRAFVVTSSTVLGSVITSVSQLYYIQDAYSVWVSRGLTSHSTLYRSFQGRLLHVIWPNQQCQSTEGSQLTTEYHCTVLQYSRRVYRIRRLHSWTAVDTRRLQRQNWNTV